MANRKARIFGDGEMAELTRHFDWSKTPIGPIQTWPDTLITTVNMMLATRHPMFLWWGPELIQFYNDSYRSSIREDKHPKALGQRGIECWPEVWPIIGPQIDAVMNRGQSSWHRNQLVPIYRHGKLEDVYWTYGYSPVRDGDGTICGTLVVCSETTEEVLSERRLRQSEARFRHLIERANLGVAIGDLVGNLAYVNPTMLKILGYTTEQVVAGLLRWTELMPDEYAERDANAIRELKERGVCQPYEKALIAEDGRRIPFLVGASMILGPADRSEEIAFFFTDLTLLKKTEDALRRAEKLAAVGRLASSIAHEINNPLASVTNLLYLIETAAQLSDVRKYAVIAQRELARVSSIVTQTLRFHRQSTNATQVRITDILEQVLHLFQGRIANAGVAVEKDFRGGEPLLSYEADFRQVFTNLIGNAIDACHGGGRIVVREREAIDWKAGDNGVRVSVADNGHGMSQETLRHIFDPFFTTKEMTGTGLGLWVTAEILRRHQATVRVRSSQDPHDHGTVFSLFFPYDRSLKLVA